MSNIFKSMKKLYLPLLLALTATVQQVQAMHYARRALCATSGVAAAAVLWRATKNYSSPHPAERPATHVVDYDGSRDMEYVAQEMANNSEHLVTASDIESTRTILRHWDEEKDKKIKVLYTKNTPIGFIIYGYNDFYIHKLAINKAHQSHGYGAVLLEDAFNDFTSRGVKKISLNTHITNYNAQKLYLRIGFIETYRSSTFIFYSKNLTGDSDINIQDFHGRTALMEAVKRLNANPKSLKILINAGADVNMHDKYGQTPLMKAASSGSLESLQLLVDNGADIDAKDAEGRTALYYTELNFGLGATKDKRFVLTSHKHLNHLFSAFSF